MSVASQKLKKDDGAFQSAGQKRALTQFFKLNEWRLVREGDEDDTETGGIVGGALDHQQGSAGHQGQSQGGDGQEVGPDGGAEAAVAAAVEQVNPSGGAAAAGGVLPVASLGGGGPASVDPSSDSQSSYYIKAKNNRRVICIWELEKTVYEFHCKCGHRGRDATFEELKNKVVGIPKLACGLVPPFSPQHKMKKTKGRGPSSSNKENRQGAGTASAERKYTREAYWKRVQAELIDMSGFPSTCSSTGKEMRYLLHVYDHASGLKVLRSIQGKSTKDLAWSLYEIFTLMDAPAVLHVGNGDEQAARYIIEELQRLCPDLGGIVMGSPQSQAKRQRVEEENARVTMQLKRYMDEKSIPSNCWSDIYQSVQLQLNKTFHTRQEDSPFEFVFGSAKAKLGMEWHGGTIVSENELSEEQRELLGIEKEDSDMIISYDVSTCSREERERQKEDEGEDEDERINDKIHLLTH